MNTDKLIFLIIGGITLVITVIIISTSFSTTSSDELTAQDLIGPNPHVAGAENARITLVEFSDFECPYCRQVVPILKGLLADYPNDLALVYRHFPLPSHAGALPAARASEAAANQGMFWEYQEELFANQPNFSQSDLELYAQNLGLNMDQFRSDYGSEDVIARVQEDADYGRSLNVRGTPTFYIVYDGKVEQLNLQSFDDIRNKVSSILGEPNGINDNSEDSISNGGPTLGTQIPANLPGNIPLNVTLDLVNNVKKDELAPSDVNISLIEKAEWPTAALGCPVEGQMYAQVVTPGYRVIAEANGETFEYHTDEEGENVVYCENPAN